MKLTHGMKITNDHEGVKREMSLQRYDEDGKPCYLIVFETTHIGEDAIKTDLLLSEYGYEMFCLFMRRAQNDLHKFKIEAKE